MHFNYFYDKLRLKKNNVIDEFLDTISERTAEIKLNEVVQSMNTKSFVKASIFDLIIIKALQKSSRICLKLIKFVLSAILQLNFFFKISKVI